MRANYSKLALFAAGAIAMLVGVVGYNFWSTYSVFRPPTAVDANDFFGVEGVETKIIDVEQASKAARSPQPNETGRKEVTLQWRCRVKSKGKSPAVRYLLTIEFLDADGFVLSSTSYDSNDASGDLAPLAVQNIFGNLTMSLTKAKKLAACKIDTTPLKTNADVEAEANVERQERMRADAERRAVEEQKRQKAQQEAEEQRREVARARQEALERQEEAKREKYNAELLASEARKARASAELSRWRRLQIGMSQVEVGTLLGRPKDVGAGYWTYSPVEGTYETRWLYFDSAGRVSSWKGP
jgi:hypothetical protein